MSPGPQRGIETPLRFPRVSGDEPPELEGCYYMNVVFPA